jgi:hypothetical protein
MGLFARFRPHEVLPPKYVYQAAIESEIEYLLNDPESRMQLLAMATFLATVFGLRLLSGSRLNALSGEHALNISALNDVTLLKEVFLAYLQAAILEPILAIGGMEEVKGLELAINILTLGSIFWWIHLVTDAFDFTDVMQHYKYHVELREEMQKDPTRYSWLRLKTVAEDSKMERNNLVGSVRQDIALWFILACIGAAWLPGIVTHRDVMHAYCILILWIIMHHACRRATSWSTGCVFFSRKNGRRR